MNKIMLGTEFWRLEEAEGQLRHILENINIT